MLDSQVQGRKARHVLTILAVDDLAAAAAFYRRAFDWRVAVEVPVYVEYILPGGLRLGLYERQSFGKNTGQVPAAVAAGELTSTELYLYPPALPQALMRLELAGARELSPLAVRAWGDEVAYFADPAGNVLAIASPCLDPSLREVMLDKGRCCREVLGCEVLDIEAYPMFASFDGDECVGFVSVRAGADACCEIYAVGVTPEQRRSGLGAKLLKAAEAFARRRGDELLVARLRRAAQDDAMSATLEAFYLKMGFCALGEFDGRGQDGPCLLWVKPVR